MGGGRHAVMTALKAVLLVGVVTVYSNPLPALRFVDKSSSYGQQHEHIVRFALTMISYSWALSMASSMYYAVLVIIMLQTTCWASFLSEERVLGRVWDSISLEAEKDAFQVGAVLLFGCLVAIILFSGGGDEISEKAQYRKRLVAFYTKHNPEKLADVDKILKKYSGNEELLFTRLQRKYSVLSATPVENAVDDVDNGTPVEAATEDVEEVKLLKEPQPSSGDSEEDEGFHLVKPRVLSPKNQAKPVSPSSHEIVKSPPRSPSSGGNRQSSTVRAAIEEARRAQEERVQQRIAQLSTKASTKKP